MYADFSHTISNDSFSDFIERYCMPNEIVFAKKATKFDKHLTSSSIVNRVLQKYSELSKEVTARGMEVTQAVVACQNMQRKQFFEQAKVTRKTRAHTDLTWSQLVGKLTHSK